MLLSSPSPRCGSLKKIKYGSVFVVRPAGCREGREGKRRMEGVRDEQRR